MNSRKNYLPSSELALNFTTLRAGISIFSFVRGLIPVRAGFSTTEKVPKPMRATLSPLVSALEIASRVASREAFATALLHAALAAISLINSVLFIIK